MSHAPARIVAIATAVPEFPLPQKEVVEHARQTFGSRFRDFDRMRPVFENAGIEMRYSVRPFSWFHGPQGWPERTEAFLEGATALFVDAARQALTKAGISATEVDTVVTVSSTGIATPSLEALANTRMGFRPDIRRVPVFGLGCAGGVTGLAIAERLAVAAPGSVVLLVAVEVCTLAFRADELTKSNIIATALFGDGAAAAIVSTEGGEGPRILASGEHLWPETIDIMGWTVDPVGFGAIFSRSIPDLVTEKLRPAIEAFLARGGETVESLDNFAFHPGGTKVVEALENVFDMPGGTLQVERDTLRAYGNMSSPTALFVLKAKLEAGMPGRSLLSALGPGFTGSFIRFDC